MKKTRRRLVTFSFYDQRSVEKQLEQMAARGWMLETPGGLFWVYRKVPPPVPPLCRDLFPQRLPAGSHPTGGAAD